MLEKTKICKNCRRFFYRVNEAGICKDCEHEAEIEKLRHTINYLCEGCKNRCNQNALVKIIKCPNYAPRIDFKALQRPVEARSEEVSGEHRVVRKRAVKRAKIRV